MLSRLTFSLASLLCLIPVGLYGKATAAKSGPIVVAHRGLLKHAPENTLSNFRACMDLRIGFEVDVRLSKDGQTVCIHDESLNRTTTGSGAVASRNLQELKQLDAGKKFSPTFQGDQIPTFDEVMALVERYARDTTLVAVDLKVADVEAACVKAAVDHQVLMRLVFIGTAIDDPQVRRKLREAHPATRVACLAQTSADLQKALADKDSQWAYLRFVPSREEMEQVHKAGKRAILVGPTVAGLERANWQDALQAGVDAVLTDYPLELAEDTRTETPDQHFDKVATRFIKQWPALSPISATLLGDHRFDGLVDEISESARSNQRALLRHYVAELDRIDPTKLSRESQVDYQLLRHHLRGELWSLDELQEWAWNPVMYTQLTGNAVYGLMSREFAPAATRLNRVSSRLEKLPGMYQQIRRTLDVKRVPPIHAETAVKQNLGLLSILDDMVKPRIKELNCPPVEKNLKQRIEIATAAAKEHQQWLEKELLPNAKGNFRIGPKLFDAKLEFSLGSKLSRADIRERAEFELHRVRAEMYSIARGVMQKADPKTDAPEKPSPEQQQAVIVAALEMAYAEIPPRDGIVEFAKKSLEMTTEFVRKRDLVTIPNDPLEIILMPEFQRGVAIAYCDSPGPLDVGQKTYYAVSPIPADWTEKQVGSFLREYNFRSIHDLTIHEAMPGHFLQIAHSNRSPRRLRALLSSGTFVEGWGVYSEQLMSEEGFLDRDPLMRLIALKWYLRGVANSILDQAIHVDGMNREDAMKLMVHDTFQEEREAALKWVRAQLTSTQLSTYFVGYQEHRDLRTAAEKAWADKFTLKRYHDGTLSFGSPPVRFVKALLLDEPIPE